MTGPKSHSPKEHGGVWGALSGRGEGLVKVGEEGVGRWAMGRWAPLPG